MLNHRHFPQPTGPWVSFKPCPRESCLTWSAWCQSEGLPVHQVASCNQTPCFVLHAPEHVGTHIHAQTATCTHLCGLGVIWGSKTADLPSLHALSKAEKKGKKKTLLSVGRITISIKTNLTLGTSKWLWRQFREKALRSHSERSSSFN